MGDWEADAIIGAGHRGAIVSLTERKSKLVRLRKTRGKTTEEVARASLVLLGPFAVRIHTITSDNRREFAPHERVAAELGAKFYFVHPYSSGSAV